MVQNQALYAPLATPSAAATASGAARTAPSGSDATSATSASSSARPVATVARVEARVAWRDHGPRQAAKASPETAIRSDRPARSSPSRHSQTGR